MKIFLATPISAIKDHNEFVKYRKSVVKLVSSLRMMEHDVICEIDEISDTDNYDSPKESYLKDFSAIIESDAFILHYPVSTPTSALVELGFALAMNKRVIIITPDRSGLPYLMRELDSTGSNHFIIINKYLGKVTTNKIIDALKE